MIWLKDLTVYIFYPPINDVGKKMSWKTFRVIRRALKECKRVKEGKLKFVDPPKSS